LGIEENNQGEYKVTNKQIAFVVVYFLLLLICAALLIISNLLDFESRDVLMPIAADGFKLVLGAMVGALSAMLGITSKNRSPEE
jgi:ABC-type transport system involved in multi-copper enzyme maturation permease subunit